MLAQFSDCIPEALKTQLLHDPDQLLRSASLIKDDKTTTVGRVDIEGFSFIVKRYNARSKGHRLKRCLRESRASRCWRMSSVFQKVGLNVATPVAMLERRWGILRGDAYFVSSFVAGDELLQWLPQQIETTQKTVAEEVLSAIASLRQRRLSHGDMKATNLLWSADQKLFFLDLDAANQHNLTWVWRRAFNRDLRRFARNGEAFQRIVANVDPE